MTEFIGWASSIVLLATIIKQIHKQWQDRTSKGVSKWLFIGQFAASVGFTVYSVRLNNWVFTLTNGLMALSAIAGLAIVYMHRKRGGDEQGESVGNG